MRRVKRFWKVALIGGAAALSFAVVAPVFGTTPVNADHLRLVDGADLFFYGDDNPDGAGTAVDEQYIVVGSNTCEFITTGASLVTVSSNADGNIKDPGLFDHGMGVKSKGANGTPCAETSFDEILKISAADGQKWIRLRLDSQPKQDAWVIVDLYDGETHVGHHELLTGGAIAAYNAGVGAGPGLFEPLRDTSLPYEAYTGIPDPRFPVGTDALNIEACANPSDSGPDSGINDNCIWHVVNNLPFTRVEITTLEDWGAVALEGGDDYAGWDAGDEGMDGGSWDTLFYRALSASDDAYSVDEDVVLNVAADGVLTNDSLPPGAITLTVTDDVDKGSLTLNNDGSFTYTPGPDYNGPDSFTYQAAVGAETDTATVSITVNPVNDPPTGDGGSLLPPVDEDDPPTVYSAEDLASDVDVGDDLFVTDADADNGIVKIIGDGSTFSYEPDPDFCGTDTITFTVVDDGQPPLSTDVGDVQQTITIEVICQNDAPIAGDDSYEFHERGAPIFADPLISTVPTVNTPPDPVDLLYNDSDVDLPGDGVDQGFLDVVGNTEPTHATLALTTDVLTVNSDGSFSYEPALLPASDPGTPGVVDSWDELGAFSYTVTWDYTVSDGYLTDTGSVSITIIRVICSDETVRDQDGDVVGAFTLLQPAGDPPKCKPYSVLANAAANAVDFIPEADGGEPELFRGLLAFTPEQQANGEYTLTLIYDPFFDPNDPLYVIQWLELPQCVNPVYQLGLVGDFPGFPAGYQAMLVVDADFDALPLIPGTSDKHSWCWAGDITLPGGGSEVYSIRQVIGLQDPRFGGGGIG